MLRVWAIVLLSVHVCGGRNLISLRLSGQRVKKRSGTRLSIALSRRLCGTTRETPPTKFYHLHSYPFSKFRIFWRGRKERKKRNDEAACESSFCFIGSEFARKMKKFYLKAKENKHQAPSLESRWEVEKVKFKLFLNSLCSCLP